MNEKGDAQMIEQEVKKIRLHWDWKVAEIPQQAVMRFAYEPTEDGVDNITVVLEMELAYLESQYCQWLWEELENKESILEAIKEKNIWEIEVTDEQGESSFVTLPSNRKEMYCGESKWTIGWEAPNLCENHTVQDGKYIIEWKKALPQETAMELTEWERFFQKEKLSQIENKNVLGIELFDRILVANQQENAVYKEIEKQTNGKVTFPGYTQMLTETRRKIHEINHATGALLGIKKGYSATEKMENIHGFQVDIFNAKNHAHHWNLNWICVQDLNEQFEKVLLAGEPNADTSNYFSRTILIAEEYPAIEEWLAEFYPKIYGENCKVTEEKILVISKEDLNQYWYEIKEEWRLL